jgi:hypothetical protein
MARLTLGAERLVDEGKEEICALVRFARGDTENLFRKVTLGVSGVAHSNPVAAVRSFCNPLIYGDNLAWLRDQCADMLASEIEVCFLKVGWLTANESTSPEELLEHISKYGQEAPIGALPCALMQYPEYLLPYERCFAVSSLDLKYMFSASRSGIEGCTHCTTLSLRRVKKVTRIEPDDLVMFMI